LQRHGTVYSYDQKSQLKVEILENLNQEYRIEDSKWNDVVFERKKKRTIYCGKKISI
jgi:hypothetical protein